jgi:hypothetical protein
VGILQVAGDETFESLLPRSVPQLKTDDLAAGCDVLADEIDANCGLSLLNYTFFVGSN